MINRQRLQLNNIVRNRVPDKIKLRAVIDTNVLLSGLLNNSGAPAQLIQYFKSAFFLRGDVFFGFAVLCFSVLIIFVIVYGDVGSYDVDPDNGDVMKNHKHEMPKSVFERYYSISKTVAAICFCSMMVGGIQYYIWKTRDLGQMGGVGSMGFMGKVQEVGFVEG